MNQKEYEERISTLGEQVRILQEASLELLNRNMQLSQQLDIYYDVRRRIEMLKELVIRHQELMSKTDLLILDDFGMKRLNAEQVIDLMEIIEDRHGRKATIIASQVPVSGWYETLESNATAADAILDRIIHSATRFELHGESLRKNV